MEPFPITARQFVWLWLAGMTVAFGGAVLLRRAQRLPFFRPKFPDAEVEQNWRSGASSRGLMGSLVRANNCLWFSLTGETLHVGAHFPFNMFIPRFLADLDLTIPVAAISSVSEKSAIFGMTYVRVEYELREGATGVAGTAYVDLWPKRGDHFFNILHEKVRVARGRLPERAG